METLKAILVVALFPVLALGQGIKTTGHVGHTGHIKTGGSTGSSIVNLSTSSIAFSSLVVSVTSPATVVTLTNVGTGTLTISSIAITGTGAADFAETTTCGGTVNAGANCTISPTFTPLSAAAFSAAVTITDSASGSPRTVSLTGTGLPGNANQPGGYTPITNRQFNALGEGSGVGTWTPCTPTNQCSIVTNTTAPASPSNVMQCLYPAGFPGGSAPCITTDTNMSALNYTRIYISFWKNLSSNFQPHSSNVNKFGFVWINNNPTVFIVDYGSSFPLAPRISIQGAPVGNGALAQNVNTVTIPNDGAWHHYEANVVSNTPGVANGTADLWIDGTHVTSFSNIEYVDVGQSNTWQYIYIQPIWGGTGGIVSANMFQQVDNYFASGAP